MPMGFEWARRTLEESSTGSASNILEVETGDYVLVHYGFAPARSTKRKAARTYKLLEEMDQLTELEVGDVEEEER